MLMTLEKLQNVTYYAGIMLDAFAILLCSKLCWHNWLKPTLQKRKYVIHTKIGMIQEFTPRIPLFGVNNIPLVCITYHYTSMYFMLN